LLFYSRHYDGGERWLCCHVLSALAASGLALAARPPGFTVESLDRTSPLFDLTTLTFRDGEKSRLPSPGSPSPCTWEKAGPSVPQVPIHASWTLSVLAGRLLGSPCSREQEATFTLIEFIDGIPGKRKTFLDLVRSRRIRKIWSLVDRLDLWARSVHQMLGMNFTIAMALCYLSGHCYSRRQWL
jgi:hypothetical protein